MIFFYVPYFFILFSTQIYDVDPSDAQIWPGVHSYREELQVSFDFDTLILL